MFQGESFIICGTPEQAVHLRLPSQEWLFRLDSYRWYSSMHRFDRLLLHAYTPMLFSESKHYCMSVHARHQLYPAAHDWMLRQISYGVLGEVQWESILSSQYLKPDRITRLRDWLRSWIAQVPSPQGRDVLQALLLGDRSAMSKEDWRLFSRTGTSHLVAVSGLHVAWMVLAFSAFILRFLGFFSAIYRRFPKSMFSSVLTILLSVFYGSFIYLSIPAMRALLLLASRSFFAFFGDKVGAIRLLLGVFFITCLFYPFSYDQPGACLSYWAVFWLLSSPVHLGREERLSDCLSMQAWILLALFPLCVFYFGHWYAISWVANVLAVPWVSLLLFPVCIFHALLYAVWPLLAIKCVWVVQLPLDALLWSLTGLAKHPLLSISLMHYGVLSVFLSLVLIWSLRYYRIRWYTLALSVPFVFSLIRGISLPVESGWWLPYGRGGVFLYRHRAYSLLYVAGGSGKRYRYFLLRMVNRLHWSKINDCFLPVADTPGFSHVCDSLQVSRSYQGLNHFSQQVLSRVSMERRRPIRWFKVGHHMLSWGA